ncbi:MAG: outer membrane beta-barrel protein [Bradyrhizobium sp.]|uniref:outer membrane protein n=1 Tax=Bradyrhizobium sp. TaxID=376 RepID=UPI001D4EDF06|nr:outer membrane beta-barrel protein [Bradyrhizobium sp.]MBV9564808.1 outer membrane beta-barrel protein [Bradyrhizobium sp.]
MKKTLLGAVSLVLSVTPALAADLPARTYTKAPAMVAAIYDWSGFYIGINGGGGSSRDCWTNTTTALGPVVPSVSEGCHNGSGGMVGGQIGYRWQSSNFVFGVEGQGDWADFKGSNTSVFAPGTVNQTKVDAIGLLTGQAGYAWNNVLWYVKGGAAVTDNKYNGIVGGVIIDQATGTRWGGAIGTGLEVGFAPNWSVGVEYDHLFMGGRTLNFTAIPGGAFTRTDNVKQDVDMASVRVNYRWGGPVVPKY